LVFVAINGVFVRVVGLLMSDYEPDELPDCSIPRHCI